MTSTSPQPRVALLGLGLMGSGMARRLLGAGFPLTIYNRTADKAASLVAEGARLAASPRDAAAGAEFVVSMVADDTASRGVWLGERRGAQQRVARSDPDRIQHRDDRMDPRAGRVGASERSRAARCAGDGKQNASSRG